MHRYVLFLAFAFAALLSAASASAATFCVNKPGCVGIDEGTNLQAALTAAGANSENDVIQVGPGTYVGNYDSRHGFYLEDFSGSVDLVGAGAGKTIIDPPAGASGDYFTLDYSPHGGTISGVTVHRAPVDEFGRHVGLGLFGHATARDIAVSELDPSDPNAGDGVELAWGAKLVSSTCDLPASVATTCVAVEGGSDNAVQDSVLSAHDGVDTQPPTDVSVARNRIDVPAGGSAGIYGFGYVEADDNLIQMHGPGQTGIDVRTDATYGSYFATVLNTITGGTGDTGISARGPASGSTATTVDVQGSIIRGVTTSLAQSPGTGSATFTVSHSDFDQSTTSGAVTIGSGNLDDADPLFVDAAAGDFRLLYGSPAIDTGDAPPWAAKDLAGKPRYVAAHPGPGFYDMGAYEYQRTPPTAVVTVTPARAPRGQSFTFDGSRSYDADPGDTLSYTWRFDDGSAAAGPAVSHAFRTGGTHTVLLIVTDETNVAGQARATVVVDAPPPRDYFAGARALKGTVRVSRGGVVRLHVRCRRPADGGCAGRLTLRAGRAALGSSAFWIAAGKTAAAKVKLTRRARRLVSRRHKLKVKALVASTDGRGTSMSTSASITLKPARRRRH